MSHDPLRALRQRVAAALDAERIDTLIVAADPWHAEPLGGTLGFVPAEGAALALVDARGGARLVLAHPSEAERARGELPGVEVSWAPTTPTLLAAVESLAASVPIDRLALGPSAGVPFRLAQGPLAPALARGAKVLDRLGIRWTARAAPAPTGTPTVDAAALDARVARMQAGMRSDGFHAMIVYASPAVPAAAAYLVGAATTAREAIVMLLPHGAPEILAGPDLGTAAVRWLAEHASGARYIGVVDLAALPWSIAAPLVEAGHAPKFVEAQGLFAIIRQPSDDADRAACAAALEVARQAVAAAPEGATRTTQVATAVEHAARAAGAEHVIVRIAADLASSPRLANGAADRALAGGYALEVTVGRAGAWVRHARCRAGASSAPGFAAAERWLEACAVRATDLDPRAGFEDRALVAPGRVIAWRVEASVAPQPLSIITASDGPFQTSPGGVAGMPALAEGAIAFAGAEIALDAAHGGGHWVGRVPVVIGAREAPGRRFA